VKIVPYFFHYCYRPSLLDINLYNYFNQPFNCSFSNIKWFNLPPCPLLFPLFGCVHINRNHKMHYNQCFIFHVFISKFCTNVVIFKFAKMTMFLTYYGNMHCIMIWNEFNRDRIFKKFIEQCNQCLLNIVRTLIFKKIFQT
jgi:hypothetical protein